MESYIYKYAEIGVNHILGYLHTLLLSISQYNNSCENNQTWLLVQIGNNKIFTVYLLVVFP